VKNRERSEWISRSGDLTECGGGHELAVVALASLPNLAQYCAMDRLSTKGSVKCDSLVRSMTTEEKLVYYRITSHKPK
jgi:hypothetical protein